MARGAVLQRLELRAVELRQAVDGVVEELRRGVVEAVPARVVGGVPEAEVGAQVDDRRAGRGDGRDDLGCGAVGQGEEQRVDVVGRGRVDREAGRGEMGMRPADRARRSGRAPSARRSRRTGGERGAGRAPRRRSRSRRRSRRGPGARDQAGGPSRSQERAGGSRSRAREALRGGLPLAETWDRMDRRHGRMTIQPDCIVMQERLSNGERSPCLVERRPRCRSSGTRGPRRRPAASR